MDAVDVLLGVLLGWFVMGVLALALAVIQGRRDG